jgi:hypothetical protein
MRYTIGPPYRIIAPIQDADTVVEEPLQRSENMLTETSPALVWNGK